MKGVLLTLVTVIAGICVSVVYLSVAGGNITPPTPMLAQCTIVSVVVTFWASIMFGGGWPFHCMDQKSGRSGNRASGRVLRRELRLVRIFFNYEFMKDAPVYVASSIHMACSTHGCAGVLCYGAGRDVSDAAPDLWPLTRSPGLMKQPVLGLVWTLIALILAASSFCLGNQRSRNGCGEFLVSVPIPFIFGTIIVLNMLQGSMFAKWKQPMKGFLSAAAAALIGTGLAWFYEAVAAIVTGRLRPGPPSYDFEIWLASALLAVTFPFLIIASAFFDFWPIKRAD